MMKEARSYLLKNAELNAMPHTVFYPQYILQCPFCYLLSFYFVLAICLLRSDY